MNRLLQDLRIVEFSAFVAAPLGGMTMAQFGAEVIRIDPIGGAIDYNRWPVADSGASLYWAGLNKAKRSVALALNKPEGRELARAIATAPGAGGGIVLTNLPPLPGLDYASLKAKRDDVILLRLTRQPRRQRRGRLHGQCRERLSAGHRQQHRVQRRRAAGQPCSAGLGHRGRAVSGDRAARRRAPPRPHRRGAGGHGGAERRDARDGRASRLCRRRPRQRHGRGRRSATISTAVSGAISRPPTAAG